MLALAAVLLAGCETVVQIDTYCDIATPQLFGSEQTIEWLLKNDRDLLVDVIVHNETIDRLCDQ